MRGCSHPARSLYSLRVQPGLGVLSLSAEEMFQFNRAMANQTVPAAGGRCVRGRERDPREGREGGSLVARPS